MNKKILLTSIALLAMTGVVWVFSQELIWQKLTSTKSYRNTEYGFSFRYPETWVFAENSFYSPFSKFNLQGNVADKNYNPFRPAFLLNVVTPDFADREFSALQAVTSSISISGRSAIRYAYKDEGAPSIAVVIQFDAYKMIVAAPGREEATFGKILKTFQFKSSTF